MRAAVRSFLLPALALAVLAGAIAVQPDPVVTTDSTMNVLNQVPDPGSLDQVPDVVITATVLRFNVNPSASVTFVSEPRSGRLQPVERSYRLISTERTPATSYVRSPIYTARSLILRT